MAINTIPIAIIGMSCRLPGGANSPEELWNMLYEGRSGYGPVPSSRWNAEAFYHPDPGARESIPFRHGHFLRDDISAFDARFFQIPPRDANGMDPQQRLLLEITYEALENAGIPLSSIKGTDTAVVMAEFARDYDRILQKDVSNVPKLHVLGCGDAILANRVSYAMDLRGPSFTLDTGCSGSLVAVHQACQIIRTGESRVAIAGGCQLILHPDQAMNMSQINMMNPDGKCYVFDDRGMGYGRGEGAGVVVLKRLDHARRDGDAIHAIIANSGVNQDGKTVGISLPSADAQAKLAKSVYAAAGLDPGKTLYVEAHGTGTEAGDKAEIASISQIFCENTQRDFDIRVGSIKANIGHLECASGIAALIKSVMVLKKGFIPANINLENLKPALQIKGLLITIPTKAVSLADTHSAGHQQVSVSGFGYGGTNAHVILQSGTIDDTDLADPDARHKPLTNGVANNVDSNGHSHNHDSTPNSIEVNGVGKANTKNSEGPQLYVLSAASKISLSNIASNLMNWLSEKNLDCGQLRDLSYTLAVRRSLHPWRSAFVASDTEALIQQLGRIKLPKSKSAPSTQVTFVFTGQGAQWYAMGRELLLSSIRFQDSISRSSELLRQWGCNWSLDEELLRDEKETRLDESQLAQPATTAIQIALVDLLADFGILPQRVCGHSSGEIGAAYAAGVLGHDTALKVSYLRGIYSKQATQSNANKGSMLATGLGEDKILPHVKSVTKGKLVVACVNSPESTTVSGDEDAIDELAESLNGSGIFNRKLKVDTAYHSHHMMTVADGYESSLTDMEPSALRHGTTFVSSVTGIAKSSDFGPSYWTQNLVSPVQFQRALQAVAQDMVSSGSQTANVFVEIGPHSSLAGPSRQVLSAVLGKSFSYSYVSLLVRRKHAIQTMLEAIGKMYELGCMIDMEKVSAFPDLLATHSVTSDLPPYSWDHTSTYWHESRLSRDHRLRRFPYHDLIGVLDVIGGIQNPRWRHHIDPESMPWLRDHSVDGFILFPGTGYISMAVEALHQLTQLRSESGTVSCFNLRDVRFVKSLIVPEPSADHERQQVEVQITLTSETGSSDSTAGWEVFRVASYDRANASWIEHCTGLIKVHMSRAVDEFEVDTDTDHAINLLSEIQAGSTTSLNVKKFYDDLGASGNVFGPTFRGLQELHLGDHEAYAKLSVPDIASSMPAGYMQPHIMHPATMDALNHVAAALYQKHNGNSPFVAAAIDELSISTSIATDAGAQLIVASRMVAQSIRGATGNTWVFQDPKSSAHPMVTITGWRLQTIGDAVSAKINHPFDRSMTYKMDWQVDVDHLSNETFNRRLADAGLYGIGYPSGFGVLDSMYFRESAALIYIKRAVQRLKETAKKVDTGAPHLAKLYDWMQQLIVGENNSMIPVIPVYPSPLPDDDAEEFILQQASRTGSQGAMLERIGSKLEEILTGNVNSLSLMFEDDLLERLYGEDMMRSNYAQMSEYIKLLSFKHPQMSILEIGAGTGGATLPLLQALDDSVDGLVFSSYCYTDISSGFFEKARVKFSHWEHRMDFKTLDVSNDPLQQPGFANIKFDLIIAANVLHATPSLDTTVANCRKLLKPGGRMILMEVTRLTLSLNTIFGTLPGWWMSEDGRKNTPTVSVPQWNAVLQRQGFEGVEIATPDHQGDTAVMTAMVCRAIESRLETNGVSPHAVKVLLGHRDDKSIILADQIMESLRQRGLDCHVEDFVVASIHENGSYIVLDIMERPILKNPSLDEFTKIQQLITSSKNVLWTSLQCSNSASDIAAKGIVNGLARVARHENTFINLVTLEVQDAVVVQRVRQLAENVASVAVVSFWNPEDARAAEEKEYAIKTDQVLIPRVRVDAKFNAWVASTRVDSKLTTTIPYRNESRPIKLEPETPGLLNTLRFVDDKIPMVPIAPHEIQLRPYAYGVNFKDVFVALGQGPPGAIMAGEVSGVVTAVGTEMDGLYRVGDRVAGMGAEPYASEPRLHGLNAHKIPDSVSFVEGASAVAVFCTAWYCLVTIANLQKDEKSGSGGVGQAAIQIAQYIGAKIYVTVGSAAKRQLLIDTYNISPSNIFSSGSTSFKDGVLRLTKGKGVDVVLNSLAGEQLKTGLECTAEFGRFIEIGKSDIYKRNRLSMAHFDKGISLIAVDFVLITRSRPQIVHDTLGVIFDLFQKEALSPVTPVTTFSVSKVEDAFRMIAARKHLGKLVIAIDEGSDVKAVLPLPMPLQLDRNGTYIIVGGLGDLGRRVCGLLSNSGAGCIVTLSRSLPSAEELQAFRQTIEGQGCAFHAIKCDVTNATSLQVAASFCQSRLPPVKGVIHSGLVLRDRPIELMTLDEYQTALRPKVHGTLNLHDAFASNALDFFILLSSSTGILGMKGQGNYAAGNTFQDAFANAHNARPSNRTRYVSLDIGAVAGSSHIARLPLQGVEMQRQSVLFMTFEEVNMLLEYAMGPSAVENNFSHCMVGFDREAMVTMQDTATLNNPMFSLLPEVGSTNSRDTEILANSQSSVDPGKLVEKAATLQEAEDIITKATAEKFSVFLDTDVPIDIPIVQLAIDSLVSIELKNWMSRTFQAPLQASEIAGALSIRALAQLLTYRSSCISNEVRTQSLAEAVTVNADADLPQSTKFAEPQTTPQLIGVNQSKVSKPSHGWECCKHSETLAKSPLVDLDDALDYLLNNSGHFYKPEEFELLKEAADELRLPNGPGRKAYAQLLERYNDSNLDSWLYDLVTDVVYLKRRNPLAPYSSFIGSNFDGQEPHTQSERAAIITLAAFDFRKQVFENDVEPYWFFGKPACTSQLRWLFDACRQPGKGLDRMAIYPESDYIVVLRRGHVFKIVISEHVSFTKLKSTFEAIIQRVEDNGFWTGILTTDNRDSWAEIRAATLSLSRRNVEYIQAIEEATFVVCLDDGAPETDSEQIRQAWFGDGFNRWADKCMQVIVAANGKSSVILEHGAIDGMTSWRLSEWIQSAILANKSSVTGGMDPASPEEIDLHEFTFQSTPELAARMMTLRDTYVSATSTAEYGNHVITAFGTDDIMAWNMPMKSVLDTMVQLAIRLHYGHSVPCWEGVSMSHYHRGRNDLLQIATPQAVDFCAISTDESVPLTERRARLVSLGRDMSANMQRCLSGRTHLRFLELLRDAWPQDAPPAKLFKTNIWWKNPFVVLQHVPAGIAGANMLHGVQNTDCFFISISPGNDNIYVAIDGTVGNVEPFARRLDEASEILKRIMQAK